MTNKELQIIGTFLRNLDEYENREMKLVWRKSGEITASFYTCFEDENDSEENSENEDFEEYISFVFDATEISGAPPVSLNSRKSFIINYHNFPDEIIIDGKKIN
ncbi:MAG: hypothetical protein IJP38_09835 [Oscillospiraceae bacterium]|nr:hypothetical protein [Oscillospiraceae bacterium]